MTDDLVTFLRSRLDEQAERAWAIHDVGQCDALLYEEDMAGAARRDPNCDCGYPARMLRKIEVDRRIIEAVDGLAGQWYDEIEGRVLELLALPYADHPDFREEWRP